MKSRWRSLKLLLLMISVTALLCGCSHRDSQVLTLKTDTGTFTSSQYPMYITDHNTIMMPVSMVTKAFSCAIKYREQRLVIQQGDVVITTIPGEAVIETAGGELALGDAAVWDEQELAGYLPAEVLEQGLGYEGHWDEKTNTYEIHDPVSGRKLLPSSYDYREQGRVPALKNQGDLGTCWAFASLLALESTLLPEQPVEFSEDHMSLQNSFQMNQEDGGEYTMSMAYLLSWQGPVLEREDPYGDGISPDGLTPEYHVQEVRILPEKNLEKIKQAVFLYGGVQSSLYISLDQADRESEYYNPGTAAYYYDGTEKPNHDSVIVGWDDNYPKENFRIQPEKDGAFLCSNSWGTEFGEDGYYYVSYSDSRIGNQNILYSGVEKAKSSQHIYQSDLCGWMGQVGYGREDVYFSNVFQAAGEELLTGAGFYATASDTEYELSVVRDAVAGEPYGRAVQTVRGTFDDAGYYTVRLPEEVLLEPDERFSIIIHIKTPGSTQPVAVEYNALGSKTAVDTSDGEGYISADGQNWESIEAEYGCNICLKAYTRDAGQ